MSAAVGVANWYAQAGRIGGYTTAARYGREAAIARGRASVEQRFAGVADRAAALAAQMQRVRLAKEQKRAARLAYAK